MASGLTNQSDDNTPKTFDILIDTTNVTTC